MTTPPRLVTLLSHMPARDDYETSRSPARAITGFEAGTPHGDRLYAGPDGQRSTPRYSIAPHGNDPEEPFIVVWWSTRNCCTMALRLP